MVELARDADKLQWIIDILIDKKMANDCVKLRANQRELAELHLKISTTQWHEINKITARLCITIGKGNILVNIFEDKDDFKRAALLRVQRQL